MCVCVFVSNKAVLGCDGVFLQQCSSSSSGARERGREGGFRVLAPRRRAPIARRCMGHSVCCCAGVIPPHKTAADNQAAACVDAEHSCAKQHSARQSKQQRNVPAALSKAGAARVRAPHARTALPRPRSTLSLARLPPPASPLTCPHAHRGRCRWRGPPGSSLLLCASKKRGTPLAARGREDFAFGCSFLGAVGWVKACVGCARLNVESFMNDWARCTGELLSCGKRGARAKTREASVFWCLLLLAGSSKLQAALEAPSPPLSSPPPYAARPSPKGHSQQEGCIKLPHCRSDRAGGSWRRAAPCCCSRPPEAAHQHHPSLLHIRGGTRARTRRRAWPLPLSPLSRAFSLSLNGDALVLVWRRVPPSFLVIPGRCAFLCWQHKAGHATGRPSGDRLSRARAGGDHASPLLATAGGSATPCSNLMTYRSSDGANGRAAGLEPRGVPAEAPAGFCHRPVTPQGAVTRPKVRERLLLSCIALSPLLRLAAF